MIIRLYTGEDGQAHFEDLNAIGVRTNHLPMTPGALLETLWEKSSDLA